MPVLLSWWPSSNGLERAGRAPQHLGLMLSTTEGQVGGKSHPVCTPLPGCLSPQRLPVPAPGRGQALAPARALLSFPPSLPSRHTSFLQTEPL